MIPPRGFVIKFEYPEGSCYAGEAGGSLGWAPTVTTAIVFEDKASAENTLANAYGPQSQRYGKVIPLWAVRQ